MAPTPSTSSMPYVLSNYITTEFTVDWKRNKYYRKIIEKCDFDILNDHLKQIVEFTRNTNFTGKHVYGYLGNIDVILSNSNNLDFYRRQKLLIGHKINSEVGHSRINNINYKMMSSNYMQNLWQNILSITHPGSNNNNNTKTIKRDF